MADFSPVQPGDPFRPQAMVWNEMLAVLNQNRKIPKATIPDREWDRASSVEILVKNTTGSDLTRFGIVGIDTPTITAPTSIEDWDGFRVFDGETPTSSSFIAITQEPILNGYVGRAVVVGLTPVLVNITNAAHGYCVPGTSLTQLTSAATQGTNGTKILWKAVSSGASTKCIVCLPMMGGADLTAGSGADVVVSVITGCDESTGLTYDNKTLSSYVTINGTNFPVHHALT